MLRAVGPPLPSQSSFLLFFVLSGSDLLLRLGDLLWSDFHIFQIGIPFHCSLRGNIRLRLLATFLDESIGGSSHSVSRAGILLLLFLQDVHFGDFRRLVLLRHLALFVLV